MKIRRIVVQESFGTRLIPPPLLRSTSEILLQLLMFFISISPLLLSMQMLSRFHTELWFDGFLLFFVCCRFAEQTRACTLGNAAAGRGQSASWTVA